jgi:hypothetical protein
VASEFPREPSAPIIVPRADDLSAPHKATALNCPMCRVQCPLGFGDRTTCVVCGGVIPIGPELRERRDSQRRLDTERRQRDPLWQLALRTRPRFWHRPQVLVSLCYMAPFVSLIAAYLAFRYPIGGRRSDYGLAGLVWLWGTGILHFATANLFKGRRPELLRELLMAQPMTLPNADKPLLLCRVCTAPLSIPPSAQGAGLGAEDVSCDHCGADNILGGLPHVTPRPDLYGVQAVHREIFGNPISQRVSQLYPYMLLLGFLGLGVLSYFAIHAQPGFIVVPTGAG